MQTKNTHITKTARTPSNPLATLILGIGAAVAVTLASPALAQSHYSVKPKTGVIHAKPKEDPRSVKAGKPIDQKVPDVAASTLPPDPCAAGAPEYDCNQNGINDLCDIADGWADANEDGILDHCQYGAGDLNLDGTVDSVDLVLILNDWGTEGYDANGDGVTNAIDLAAVLSNWSTKG